MLCKELKVVNLNITEDHYQYKALFRLCSDNACMDIDMAMLDEETVLAEIKTTFEIQESADEIKAMVTLKVMEASSVESRIKEGKDYNESIDDKKIQKNIDSLSRS